MSRHTNDITIITTLGQSNLKVAAHPLEGASVVRCSNVYDMK